MLPSRLLLRRPPRIKLCRSWYGQRLQHGQFGPHKEYFQNPSQYPSNFEPAKLPPDLLPAAEQIRQGIRSQQRPFILRALRATSLVFVSLILGGFAGATLITWEYFQPPFERGTEEYDELLEEIEEILETAPIVEDFRAQGWHEDPAIPVTTSQVVGSKHFVRDTLSGVQGLTVKHFRHPELSASALVFFAGFGIEGWPDVLHGGTIMSIMQEARERNMEPMVRAESWTRTEGLHSRHPAQTADFSFIAPLQPGDTYTVLVLDTQFGTVLRSGSKLDIGDMKLNAMRGTDEHDKLGMEIVFGKSVILLSGDNAPEIVPEKERTDVRLKNTTIHAQASINEFFSSPVLKRRDGEELDIYEDRVQNDFKAVVKRWKSN